MTDTATEERDRDGIETAYNRTDGNGGQEAQGAVDEWNTTYTLEPLRHATPQDWLGSNQDPDVLLSVPNLGVDKIALTVDNLRAHVELHAKVLDLLELHVGADASIDQVKLEIDNVRVQAMLKVKLDRVVEIVDRVLTTIDNHPEILTSLTGGLGEGLRNALSKEDRRDISPSMMSMDLGTMGKPDASRAERETARSDEQDVLLQLQQVAKQLELVMAKTENGNGNGDKEAAYQEGEDERAQRPEEPSNQEADPGEPEEEEGGQSD